MKAVIIDFDGTLANTANVLQKIYNEMAIEKGWPSMTTNDYKRLRKGSLRQALTWAGVHPWQLPWLLNRGRKRFMDEIAGVELFTGMKELLEDLKQNGWDLYVLSQNSSKAIEQVIANSNVKTDIQVLGRASIFGKHRNLRRFLLTHSYKKQDVWIIGDEVRDVDAAKRVGIQSIAVSWGLQDKSVLAEAKPNLVASTPDDITNELC